MKILYLEDHQFFGDTVIESLKQRFPDAVFDCASSYNSAKSLIEKNNYDTIFIVSDNIEYAKQFMLSMNTMGKNIKFIEDEPMFVDMLILSHCRTLIIGNSTLSAWSGYFNKYNNVYVPNVWIKHHGTNDLPKEWKIL